ncbi:fibronectin type III domain-containing protein [Sinomonas atrocyanea]
MTWASEPLKSNGEPVTSYDVLVYRGGSLAKTVSGVQGTQQQVTGLDTSSTYTFALVAHNNVGASPQGARSNPVTPYGRPGAVSNLSAAPANTTGNGGQVQLSFSPATANGDPVSGYQYSIDGGSSWGSLASDKTVSGLQNGTTYSFLVRAVNSAGPGPSSNRASANPYGQPKTPVANAATDGIRVKMTWNTGGYDNGRPSTVSVTIDGNAVANDGAATVGNGPDEAHSITVKACVQGEPTNCSSKSDSARTASPSASLAQGPRVTSDPQCASNACYYFDITARNFHPNASVFVQCWNNAGGDHVFASFHATTDANGYFNQNSGCYLGHNAINPWSAGWATLDDGRGGTARTNNYTW